MYRDGSLIGTARKTGRETTFALPSAEPAVYRATALDRLWNESPPSPPLC